MNKKSYLILKDQKIIKGIILLSLPIMISNILKSLHDIVDMYFISNLTDKATMVEAQVSAITITGPIMQICQALAIGLMIAGTAIMSQYIGSKSIDKARKVSGQLLLLSITIGIIFNILLFFGAPLILKAMKINPTSDLFSYSLSYVRYRSFELIGLFIFYAFQASRQSLGDTFTPVVLNAIAIVLNIILTSFFIKVLLMDLKGAALATVLANIMIIPFCLIIMANKHHNVLALSAVDLRPNFSNMKKLFIVGVPAAISQAFTSLGFLLINSLVAGFDGYIINAIGVGNRINALLLFPAMSIGSVLTTFIGQNIGASQIKRAKQGLWYSMIMVLVITIVGASILMFLRKPLVSIFIKNTENAKAFDMGVYYLYFLLMALPLMGIFQIWLSTFQGTGRTDLSLLVATARLWLFRLPLIWFLMKVIKLQAASIWYAMIISNFATIIFATALYVFVDFKPRITQNSKKILE